MPAERERAPRLFDAHFHIIDPRFPLVPNAGYLPAAYGVADYRQRLAGYRLAGGVVVSGSFQAFDQGYLLHALRALGPGYVGVTQLPAEVPDARVLELAQAGVRGLRFNLYRGGSAALRDLEAMARRVWELARWHVELYVDGRALADLAPQLLRLPAVSVDHVGLFAGGLGPLVDLAAAGVRVKASGFGRLDFDPAPALARLYAANPQGLMFGSDLPGTRAPRPFCDADVRLIRQVLGPEGAQRVLCSNAQAFYRIGPAPLSPA